MTDWKEELKRMEKEKEILDRAFEEGRLCWYREPWEEEPYPEEMEEEVKNGFWEEDETPSYPDEETTKERYWWAKWVR